MNCFNKFRLKPLVIFLALSLFIGIVGCESGNDVSNASPTSNAGSVVFDIVWENAKGDTEKSVARGISDVCGSDWDEVSWVKAGIYDGDTQVAVSQEWSCSAGSGTITGVRPGTGFSLFVIGLNSDDDIVYSGVTSIDVSSGETTNAGTIVAIRSYVTKKRPSFSGAMDIDPYDHKFEWFPALGITQYSFQIKDGPWNEPGSILVVSERPVEGTSFTITPDQGLNPNTTYYWGVFALGFDDSSGYDNTWSFTTGTTVPEDNYEENDSLATAWNNAGDPANWDGTWLSDIGGSGTAVFGDDDWYQIEADTSGYERIMIECRFIHGDNGDIDLHLYDAAGTWLESSDSATDNEYIDVIVPSIGIYYIMIEKFDAGTNTYDLYWNDVEIAGAEGVWTLEVDWWCDDEIEGTTTAVLYPNNRFVTIGGGGSWLLTDDEITMIYGNGTTYTAPISAPLSDINLIPFAAFDNGSFDVTPDTLIWGQGLDIAWAVLNDGSETIPAGTSVYLSFYLSNDTSFYTDAFDSIDGTMVDFDGDTGCWSAYRSSNSYDYLLGDEVKLEYLYSNGLMTNWYEYGTNTFTLPASAPDGFTESGTYYIGMVIDEWNDLDESDETDNFGMGLGLDYQSVNISPFN